MSSARNLPSVAWPDVTGEFEAQMEHTKMQRSELVSALRASQASEIELQRQLDLVQAQLERGMTGRGGAGHDPEGGRPPLCRFEPN
jgi:hypothetical protein